MQCGNKSDHAAQHHARVFAARAVGGPEEGFWGVFPIVGWQDEEQRQPRLNEKRPTACDDWCDGHASPWSEKCSETSPFRNAFLRQ